MVRAGRVGWAGRTSAGVREHGLEGSGGTERRNRGRRRYFGVPDPPVCGATSLVPECKVERRAPWAGVASVTTVLHLLTSHRALRSAMQQSTFWPRATVLIRSPVTLALALTLSETH